MIFAERGYTFGFPEFVSLLEQGPAADAGCCCRHLRKDLVDALRVEPPLVDEELVRSLDEQP